MSEKRPTKTRREFLKDVLVGGGAAALAAASARALAREKKAVLAAKPAAPTSQGYHVTPHIEAYYKTAAV